jgi:hypothetical protein
VTHDHGGTATAVGHATLSTGVFPSRHGIVGNSWLERSPEGWLSVYAVEDSSSLILGHPAMEGRSPLNLLRGGLADWVLEADSAAIVASVSRKDRAAILMAGTARGHVYWITPNQGRFVTSKYYSAAYPAWVERFNARRMPELFGDSVWEQTLSPEARALTRGDTSAYEGDGIHTFFPHRFRDETRDPDRPGALNRWAFSQTHPDAAVGAFAEEAVRSLGMGQDKVTDYLALSFSQADAIGHAYGPRSREQLENLLHLDWVLGDLMRFLDTAVGGGRWLLALTSDHGVLDIPETMPEAGGKGARATSQQLAAVRDAFDRFRDVQADPLDREEATARELEKLPYVADAVGVSELSGGPAADSFVVLARNSYHPERWTGGFGSEGSGVVVRFQEAFYPGSDPRGTGHGSPYHYDRWVPLIFMGSGVAPGVSGTPARTIDIAPTLAQLSGIPTPPDLDGRPLLRR